MKYLAIAALVILAVASAQVGRGRSGRSAPRMPEPLPFEDHTGFQSLFDGKSLNGWDGDPALWRVENGEIIGESTPEKPVKVNTFLIWRGGEPADFELKVEVKMNSTNSGIQYRSAELPEVGKWVLKGYQADIDFANVYTGQLYEERMRGFLALRGQVTYLQQGRLPQVIAALGSSDELKSLVKVNDWNQYDIIARGNVLTHILNGRLMSQAIDDDAQDRALRGLIGLQMHVGPPMKLEARNIWLKKLQ
jgi:hypothetical protein